MHQLPVVVTAVGALPVMIQHATNGLLVPNNDAAAFADALTLLIENETLRNEIGAAFYATVQEQFGANAIVARYLNWLVTL
jgi:glycosyltransferase involved in cell wall biosynthesis